MTTRTHSADPDHKKSFRRSWRSSGPVAKLTVVCTGIVALATVLYAGFAGWQLNEIHKGGEDTHRLAEAAQRQANATSEQVNAMRGQLDAMKEQTNTLNKSLEETRKVAGATEKQANASMSQAKASQIAASAAKESAVIARRGMEPVVGVFAALGSLEPEQEGKINLRILNEGGSLARSVTFKYSIVTNTKREVPGTWLRFVSASSIDVLPRKDRLVIVPIARLSADKVSEIKAQPPKLWLFIHGVGTYRGVDGAIFPIEFCYVYRGEANDFGECSDITLINEQQGQKPN